MKGVIGIRNGYAQLVTEHSCGFEKGYVVFPFVLLGLARIPVEVHRVYSSGLFQPRPAAVSNMRPVQAFLLRCLAAVAAWAASATARNARFTDSLSGNKSARSGSISTRLVPAMACR